MVISGVTIYTMDDQLGVIDHGYVCVQQGKITAVGAGEPPADAEDVREMSGILFPGLIDGHTHMGIINSGLTFEGDDVNEMTDPSTPQLRALDGINAFDEYFSEAVAAGVTTVAIAPGSANPIGGQICVAKTYGHRIDDMVIRQPAAIKFATGENPKSVYHGKNQAPETRMSTAAIIRESLLKAQKYAEQIARAKDDEDEDEPEFDFKLEALLPLLSGEIAAHFHAHRADDIFTAMRIANEFHLNYRIVHCTEGHLVADTLAREGVQAFVGPNLSDRSKPELGNMTFENPGILSRAGVKVAITTDHPVTPIGYLPLCAALAVKSGLSREDAYRAVTIHPAQMLDLEDRIGSITVGKDADFVLFDGDPLEMMTKIKAVFINGEAVSPKSERPGQKSCVKSR